LELAAPVLALHEDWRSNGQHQMLVGRNHRGYRLYRLGTFDLQRDGEVPTALSSSAKCMARTRHLWVHGGARMGKTALFLPLRKTHIGGKADTAFAIFRRDGYVLMPIETYSSSPGSAQREHI
jgi:hypothetical protein